MIEKLPKTSNKKGWPWTEESTFLSSKKPEGDNWPKITIVTPSYNQGHFIEETIRSILLQNYPNLEYIIIDGGSSDNTIDIIKKYDPWISFWVSERDSGQSDAINRGFLKSTGVYGNWINSDDLLERNALWTIAKRISNIETKEIFIGDYKIIDIQSKVIREARSNIRQLEELVDIERHWRNGRFNQIGQQATFFPIDFFKSIGMLNIHNHYTMDYELWGRFLLKNAVLTPIHSTLGVFRTYSGQKISFEEKTTRNLICSSYNLIVSCKDWKIKKKTYYLLALFMYTLKYYYGYIRSKIGIRRRTIGVFKKLKLIINYKK